MAWFFGQRPKTNQMGPGKPKTEILSRMKSKVEACGSGHKGCRSLSHMSAPTR